MRIVFLAAKLNIVTGGGAHYGLDLKMRTLQALGHEITLVTFFQGDNRFPPEGVPYAVIEEPLIDRRFLPTQRHVAEILKKYESQADIFYLDGVSFIWAGGMYRKNGGQVPTVAYLSTYIFAQNLLTPELPDWERFPLKFLTDLVLHYLQFIKHRLWAKFVGLNLIRHLDLVYAISPLTKELYARLGFPTEKMQVVPEFVDVSNFHPLPAPSSRTFSAQNPLKLLYTGRLLYMKGLDQMLRILRDLTAEGLGFHLAIVGDGPQKPMLERLVTRLGLEEQVTFHGWTTSTGLAMYYRECDLFIHPCRLPEPFGRTVLEVMACGKPVVTSDWTGSAWVAGEGGLLFKHNDWQDLKDVLRRSYSSPALLEEKSAAALERVAYFDVNHWVRVLEESLRNLRRVQGR